MKLTEARRVIITATPIEVMEGAGVKVRRVLPSPDVPYPSVDPFLLLDDASIKADDPGFPRHPHRGFEIITYLLTGSFGHNDNLGNSHVVRAGGLQRITAGAGMWHSEMPGGEARAPSRGLQLWINLAKAEKGADPAYEGVQPEEVPTFHHEGAEVRLLAGESGAVQLLTPSLYFDARVEAGRRFEWETPHEFSAFAYILEGDGAFGTEDAPGNAGSLLVFGEGDGISAQAGESGDLRFVVCAGKPHREPVQWRGPFVD